jgi:hypothetical protein
VEYELEGFWDRVEVKSPNECWEWKGGLNSKGCYGQTSYDYGHPRYSHNKLRRILAHRLAWILHHQKEIPKGLIICHTCDNPRCCNPAHLFAGTHKDNSQDASKKGRLKGKRGYGIYEGLARLANNK